MKHLNCSNIKFKYIIFFFLTVFCINIDNAQASNFDNTAYEQDLKLYVQNNLVNYAKWKNHQKNLNEYLESMSKVKDDVLKSMSQDEKKAFWINVYNAFTIHLVLKFYPIKGSIPYYPPNSIRQIKGFWECYKVKIGSNEYSLSDLEHDYIRTLRDPRVHFVVCPAAMGGGKINNYAYNTDNIENSLASAEEKFLKDRKNIIFKNHEIFVSRLFKWFPLDFATRANIDITKFPPPSDQDIILAYLKKTIKTRFCEFSQNDSVKYHIEYLKFDWRLNEK